MIAEEAKISSIGLRLGAMHASANVLERVVA